MFRRRTKRSLIRRIRELIWPSLGWRRSALYLVHRVRRLPGTPYSIAAGFACGAAISFTPFFGLHFVMAAVFAWLVRGSLLASAFGTMIGNPWTFPFILIWLYHLGNWIMGDAAAARELPKSLSLTYLVDHPLKVLLPMLIGSIPMVVGAWLVAFWPVRMLVAGYQRARLRRRIRAVRPVEASE